jgi:hypothetical protein
VTAEPVRRRTLIVAIVLTSLPALPLLLGALSRWVPQLGGFCARLLP